MFYISLPESLRPFLEAQTAELGLSDPGEYVQRLLAREQARLDQIYRIDMLLLEGLNSGSSIEATDEWWDQKRDSLSQRTVE